MRSALHRFCGIALTFRTPWLLLLLAGCSSPPSAPTPDEARRRPVNSAPAVELLICRNELHNTRLQAIESGRLAQAAAVTLARLGTQAPPLAGHQTRAPPPAMANRLFTVRLEAGGRRVDLPSEVAGVLVGEAKAAPLVMLRGRSEGGRDVVADSQLALAHAATVRDYLVAAGIAPSRIRITYQPTEDGDRGSNAIGEPALAGLSGIEVDIEVYRALPVPLSAAPPLGVADR